MRRFRGRGWAIIPVVSIVGVIFAIRYASGTASWITYLALVAVPLLAAAALAGVGRGGRWWLWPAAAGLFVLAWRTPGSLLGEASGAILDGLSCVTLGVLLGALTPSGWLKLGIVAMAAADVWLVASDLLQQPNDVLGAAAPASGLPQLQSEQFGSVTLGYGDLFVAGLLGAVWSAQPRIQWRAAVLTLGIAIVFDLLFLVVDELPATVPVALALIVLELARRVSARRARSMRAAATPRPGT